VKRPTSLDNRSVVLAPGRGSRDADGAETAGWRTAKSGGVAGGSGFCPTAASSPLQQERATASIPADSQQLAPCLSTIPAQHAKSRGMAWTKSPRRRRVTCKVEIRRLIVDSIYQSSGSLATATTKVAGWALLSLLVVMMRRWSALKRCGADLVSAGSTPTGEQPTERIEGVFSICPTTPSFPRVLVAQLRSLVFRSPPRSAPA